MSPGCALVYFPGWPGEPWTLMPSRSLALAAGALTDAGHPVRVYDYGTVTLFDRLYPAGARTTMEEAAARIEDGGGQTGPWEEALRDELGPWAEAYGAALRAQGAETARVLSEAGHRFVAFRIVTPLDLFAMDAAVKPLRALREDVLIAAFGPGAAQRPFTVLRACRGVAAVCCDAAATAGLCSMAAHLGDADAWRGVWVRGRGGRAPALKGGAPGALRQAPPAYGAGVYPGIAGDDKLKLFAVDEEIPANALGDSGPRERAEAKPPLTAVAAEVAHLQRLYNARAFVFPNPATPPRHAAAIAHGLRVRGLNTVFARSVQAEGARELVEALRGSGCAALDLTIGSGSQRLLDGYYGYGFTVSAAEEMVRASKAAGLFTAVRFRFPCPADDYHTRAETLRFVARTRPHGVSVDPFPPATEHWRPDEAGVRDFRGPLLHLLRMWRWACLPPGADPPYEREGRRLSYRGMEVQARDNLVRALSGWGGVTYRSGEMALLARLASGPGHTRLFAHQFLRAFLTGDAATVYAIQDRINASACPAARAAAPGLLAHTVTGG